MTVKSQYREQIIIEPYNPLWQQQYEQEATALKHCFQEKLLGIEHYGSTSVNGMWAKPVIGILLGLHNWQLSEHELQTLMGLGYSSSIPCSVPCRTYLKKLFPQRFTLAIVTYESTVWLEHLVIRDYLRCHQDERTKYSAFKREAITQGYKEPQLYRNYKKCYMQALFERAKIWYCKNYLQPTNMSNVHL